jgi:hypothetical protein
MQAWRDFVSYYFGIVELMDKIVTWVSILIATKLKMSPLKSQFIKFALTLVDAGLGSSADAHNM